MHRSLLAVLITTAACTEPDVLATDGGAPGDDASPPAPSIADVLDCATVGNAGVLPAGTDMRKVEIDTAVFPAALCNDGTPAVFYVQPAQTAAGRDRWMIQLQGGGGCHDPESCARRWCAIGAQDNIGVEHMTSRNAPPSIAATGIQARDARNPYADANHVLLRYCSSDNHGGRTGPIDVDAHHPITMEPIRYRIEFHGRDILDAMIATLRQDGASVGNLADLDDATDVVLAGASAGGGGAISNADYLGEMLRAHSNDASALRYTALIDSTFGPEGTTLDWSTATMCTGASLCTFGAIIQHFSQMYVRETDASCASHHPAGSGTEWQCQDSDHILRNHVTTPFFVRQGLRDRLLAPNAVESMVTVPGRGLMSTALFEELVRADLLALASIQTTAEEGASITQVPGAFGPPCTKHETLSDTPNALAVSVTANGTSHTMFDLFTAWQAGQGQTVVWSAGMPASCP